MSGEFANSWWPWDARTTAAAVSAIAAIFSAVMAFIAARYAWRSTKAGIAKEYLQTKTACLQNVVSQLHQIDLQSPFMDYFIALGRAPGETAFAGETFFRVVLRDCANISSTTIPMGHYLNAGRQIKVGELISSMNLKTDEFMQLMTEQVKDPRPDGRISDVMGELRQLRNKISYEIQDELDEAVVALKKQAGIKG